MKNNKKMGSIHQSRIIFT